MHTLSHPRTAHYAPRVRTRIGPLLVVGALAACLTAVGLLSLASEDFAVGGLRGTDVVAIYGLPIVRVIAEIAATLCIGSFLFAAFLLPKGESSPDALRMARWSGVVWGAAALLSVPFTLADVYARPLSYILEFDRLVDLAFAVEPTRAWMLTACIAFALAIAARFVSAPILLALALLGLVPVAASGHSSSGGDHDWATSSLLIHLLAAALWVGGLVALLAYGRTKGEHLNFAATRFSSLALGCWIALAASGTINALIRLRVPEVFTTPYGLLVLAKAAALTGLGIFGYHQRKRGIPQIGTRGTLVKLAAFEVLLMLVTIGLAAALSRTPPPRQGLMPQALELKLGYVLNGPPSVVRLIADWRFDLILGTLAIGLAAWYLVMVSRSHERWPVSRSVAWLGGCLAILIASSSGIGRYAPALLSLDLTSTTLLAIVAPMLLALGFRYPVKRFQPPVVLALFTGSLYLLYFTGLFEWSLERPLTHMMTNIWFLVVGYLFFATVLNGGIPSATKRIMLFAAAGTYAVFGTLLLTGGRPLAREYYIGLRLPWPVDLLEQQQLGGAVTLGLGVGALLLLALAQSVPQRHRELERARA
jgi:cytochrome c oxidase assembly factor CtaG/putative copper export protein